MTTFDFAVTGNASLALEGAKLLRGRGHRVLSFTARDPALIAAAEAEGFATGPIADCDYLLSLANLELLDRATLARARRAAINFHDGPLPERGGLNAPVWALLEGDDAHAITWHRIEGGVDSGPVLLAAPVRIQPGDSALTLNARCWETALETLPLVVDMLERGDDAGTPQPGPVQRLHRRADRPSGAALVDPSRPAADLARLIQALDHGPYWNPLLTPRLLTASGPLLVTSAEPAGTTDATPGRVIEVSDESAVIACAGGSTLRLQGFAAMDGQPAAHGLQAGDTLPLPDPDQVARLDAVISQAARDEPFWRGRLGELAPLSLPDATPSAAAPDWARLRLVLPSAMAPDAILAALCGAIARMSGVDRFDLALARPVPPEAAGHVLDFVPLPVDVTGVTLGDLAASLGAALSDARTKGPILADLIARAPELSRPGQPDLALAAAPEQAPQGAAICLALPDGPEAEVTLWHDRNRLSDDACRAIIEVAEALAAAPAATSLATAPTLRPGVMSTIAQNDSTAPAEPATIAAAFAAQVARTPDATALIFQHERLSYSELAARAGALAGQLAALGIGPGKPVGLFLPRGLDLVIGALAILMAGGAYVPLDPDYPSERIAHYLSDSGASVVLASAASAPHLPRHTAQVLMVDATGPSADPTPAAGEDLAYLIYTSGSTGTPKGVMVEHRNVMNFFAGMDATIPPARDGQGTWLAVTSLSFDISVLEIFWTLTRGWRVVIAADLLGGAGIDEESGPAQRQGTQFSLFYWGNDDGAGPRKYELLLEGARFADRHGFVALWTPERHFHAFGGPYPNPAVTGAAVAAVTRNLGVRAGSCVAPLHHTARIAEEWAVIDNLTNGRAGLAIASGWQPDDFVLRPENTPPRNKPAMAEAIDQLRRLWRGEAVGFPRADGSIHEVLTQPRPVSKELPVWVTTAGNPETWREAGRLGAHVLTHLLGQSIADIAARIPDYHQALREAGHDPARFTVTLMLHSYLAPTRDEAMETARGPMKDYLRAAAALVKQYAWAFPAFKKPAGISDPMAIDLSTLSEDEMDGILEFAFLRYFNDSGLFGTVDDAAARIAELREIGVGEIACLIDYGIPTRQVLEGLTLLAQLHDRVNPVVATSGDHGIAALIRRHGVTHLQATPSMLRLLLEDPASRTALSGLQLIALGGEALPAALLADLRGVTQARILNMYGPTETTIWSTVADLGHDGADIHLGQPIAGTSLHLRDGDGQPVADGVAAELWIGGAGVSRGYWQRPELNAVMFRDEAGQRLYRTGDLVRRDAQGELRFLGRVDQQVKLRGYRIELGEIEARLAALPGVREAVVIARSEPGQEPRLLAYVTGAADLDPDALRAALAADLPDFMRPARIVRLDAMPLTPNRKTDRKALATRDPAPPRPAPAPVAPAPAAQIDTPQQAVAATGDLPDRVAAIAASVLGLGQIPLQGNFFSLGGHSLLAVQMHRRIRDELGLAKSSITDIFRFPVIADLAAHLGRQAGAPASSAPVAPVPATTAPTGNDATETPASAADMMAARRALRARLRGDGAAT